MGTFVRRLWGLTVFHPKLYWHESSRVWATTEVSAVWAPQVSCPQRVARGDCPRPGSREPWSLCPWPVGGGSSHWVDAEKLKRLCPVFPSVGITNAQPRATRTEPTQGAPSRVRARWPPPLRGGCGCTAGPGLGLRVPDRHYRVCRASAGFVSVPRTAAECLNPQRQLVDAACALTLADAHALHSVTGFLPLTVSPEAVSRKTKHIRNTTLIMLLCERNVLYLTSALYLHIEVVSISHNYTQLGRNSLEVKPFHV